MNILWDILETCHKPFANKSPTITAQWDTKIREGEKMGFTQINIHNFSIKMVKDRYIVNKYELHWQ